MELLSALAKDLPVSEDLDLAVDVEHLKAPPFSRKRLVMLVGVFSSGNNFERRMALRRTWMQYEAVRSGDVAVRFFIGLVSSILQAGASLFICLPNEHSSICSGSSDVHAQGATPLFLVILFISKLMG